MSFHSSDDDELDPLSRARGRCSRARSRLRLRPELGALIGIAGVLNLWGLSINGWANTYYCAAVRSMTTSWHNFLFASLDQSGLMTVDKPPLSLWVQALSARVFGFHPLSLLIPQALMGAGGRRSCYDLTRRRFGRPAGFVGRPGAGHHADRGRHVAPQQPRRAAGPVLRGRAVVRGARARGRPDEVAGAQRGVVRRARLRDQDGGGADGGAGDRARLAVDRAGRARAAARAAPAAGSAAPRWSRWAARGRCWSRSRPRPTGPGSRAPRTTASGR